jgi:hypothetical protein
MCDPVWVAFDNAGALFIPDDVGQHELRAGTEWTVSEEAKVVFSNPCFPVKSDHRPKTL